MTYARLTPSPSSSIQTVTVGPGVPPSQPPKRVADFTASRELHPALKRYCLGEAKVWSFFGTAKHFGNYFPLLLSVRPHNAQIYKILTKMFAQSIVFIDEIGNFIDEILFPLIFVFDCFAIRNLCRFRIGLRILGRLDGFLYRISLFVQFDVFINAFVSE